MTFEVTRRPHLTKAEMVDFAEGQLPSTRLAHVNECETCRQEAEDLRRTLGEVSDVATPEPSPLFWPHLSERVAEAVTRDSVGSRRVWWQWSALSHLTTAAASAAAVLAVVVGVSFVRTGAGPGNAHVPSRLLAELEGVDEASNGGTADWTLLLTMAETVDWREAETDLLMVDQHTVEAAVFDLSDEERRALVQLLEAELQEGKGL